MMAAQAARVNQAQINTTQSSNNSNSGNIIVNVTHNNAPPSPTPTYVQVAPGSPVVQNQAGYVTLN